MTRLESRETAPPAAADPDLIDRERQALADVTALCTWRDREESGLLARYATRRAGIEKSAADETAALEERYARVKGETENALDEARARIPAEATAAKAQATAAFEAARKRLLAQASGERSTIDDALDRARWEASSVYEAGASAADEDRKIRTARLTHEEAVFESLAAETEHYLARHRMRLLAAHLGADGAAPEAPSDDPLVRLEESNAEASGSLHAMASLTLPRLLSGGLPFFLYLLSAVGVGILAALFVAPLVAVGVGVGVALVVGSAAWWALHRAATGRVNRIYPELVRQLERSERLIELTRSWIAERDQVRRAELKERHARDLRQADRKAAGERAASEERRETALAAEQVQLESTLAALVARRDEALREAEASAATKLAGNETRYAADRREAEGNDAGRRSLLRLDEQRDWAALVDRWQTGVGLWNNETSSIEEADRNLFLNWSEPDVLWTQRDAVAPAMRFGEFTVNPASLPAGAPRDERLKRAAAPRVASLPALTPFPEEGGSLLVRAYGDGRGPGIARLQAMMLRLLTSTPPGKLRFTIVDPVGLGRNFAAFMHLADYDEAMVTSRIWTEPQHIEKKLAELTEHMEKVIQKYLRNEYRSIGEYNAIAGEVAEPFRVLVVANFPANFTEQAARRLVSIAQSGPRCGVFTLISVDEREPLPPGVALGDLESSSAVLAWREGRFAWKDVDFGGFALTLDEPPADETLTRLMHQVGAAAKNANRVEVPFDVVAPPAEAYWTQDSSEGVEVPLGRVGATKFQNLSLGRGTSQHVLIAGRTGSGKSTLLHALITNAALRYSPDQIELYLIDFKKGVEFKTYAAHQLPHARVVAIESEREFGLSVLQRLDDEMKRRGELFRAENVQDLAGFREARSDRPMPRVMLIVDEFQEFFVEDDRLAQDAALLLDRLVRQGRAFGIHILLGSQTLGGAFSLARSTLGQMAVRIALQCSEADAHLILSEDNGAARLLSRPGEAIYNDANGMVEGNHFFQVVFLTDSRKDAFLDRVRELDDARGSNGTTRSQIVFEGNLPADLTRNALLRAALATEPSAPPRAVRVWLGDAVAIKDPTEAVFRRQSGANLLIVGQQDEAALGIELAAIVGLVAQFPAGSESPPLRIEVLDGTPDDSDSSRLIERSVAGLPVPVRCGTWRDTAAVIDELTAEIERRQNERLFDEPPIFLVIHDISRFRDLRKSDDDFGFGMSRGEERPSPSKQFATLLRDGSGVGVHVIAWCDSLNNLNRSLDRQALREFEMRVLFQMSPNDSSSLIDTPAAGKLGPNRALFSSEEEGRSEKFRPYAPPSPAWWDELRAQLSQRRPAADPATGP